MDWFKIGKGVRESIPKEFDKESGALEEEGIQGPREGERGPRLSRRRKGQTFYLHCFVLDNETMYLAQGLISP